MKTSRWKHCLPNNPAIEDHIAVHDPEIVYLAQNPVVAEVIERDSVKTPQFQYLTTHRPYDSKSRIWRDVIAEAD